MLTLVRDRAGQPWRRCGRSWRSRFRRGGYRRRRGKLPGIEVRAARRLAPHVLRQALALKDVPAGEADLLLNVRRAHHLCFEHGVGDVGAETADGVEGQLRTRSRWSPRSRWRTCEGTYCAKHAHGVLAGGNHGRVVHALKINLAPQVLGQVRPCRGGEAGLPFRVGQRRVDLAVVMGLQLAGTSE